MISTLPPNEDTAEEVIVQASVLEATKTKTNQMVISRRWDIIISYNILIIGYYLFKRIDVAGAVDLVAFSKVLCTSSDF